MNIDEMIIAIEGYYGKYKNLIIKRFVREWLADYRGELNYLYKILIREYSANYGKAPDTAVLQKVADKYRGELKRLSGNYTNGSNEVFRNHIMVGHYAGGRFYPALYLMNQEKMLTYKTEYYERETPDHFVEFIGIKKQLIEGNNRGEIESRTKKLVKGE